MQNKRLSLKKTGALAFIAIAITALCSCSSAYLREQDEASKYKPCDCTDYHINHAEWHYIDRFGQKVDVTGKCSKGMKHGNFDFYVGGILVARTKFSRDEEVKTRCYVKGIQTYNLYTCMNINANGINATVAPAAQQTPVKKSVWD